MNDKTDFDKAMDEFLASGGEVQQIARGVQSETATTNFWGAPKKKPKVANLEAETDAIESGDPTKQSG